MYLVHAVYVDKFENVFREKIIMGHPLRIFH